MNTAQNQARRDDGNTDVNRHALALIWAPVFDDSDCGVLARAYLSAKAENARLVKRVEALEAIRALAIRNEPQLHDWTCKTTHNPSNIVNRSGYPCDCGVDAALAAAEKA